MIFISEKFKSYVNLVDFAQPELSIEFSYEGLVLGRNELFFDIKNNNYSLSLQQSESGTLILSRNKDMVSVDLCSYDLEKVTIWVILSPKQLGFVISLGNKIELSNRLDVAAAYPPTELISYIRNQSLAPVFSYKTEESLREKIQNNLLWINKKISSIGGYKSYWNLHYDGNKIVNREPKKETEIQPLIHQAIYDVMESSGISINPEYPTGDGNVDFLFSSSIEGIGIKTVCVELKLAHSKDIIKGYTHQLPKYMTATNSKYGIYVVLNYKGSWFDCPTFSDGYDVYHQLMKASGEVEFVEADRIRVVEVQLAKPLTASKI